jgi:hypothetical protein
MKYPLLLPTLSHGSTDLIDSPKLTLISHSIGFLTIKFIPICFRKGLLLISSIIHMKRDMSLFNSFLMHILWLKIPILSKIYLSFYHTPLHYIRSYYYNPQLFLNKIIISLFTTFFINFSLNNNFHLLLENYFGKLWWISPVIIHIIISEILIHQKHLIIKQNLTIPIKAITII